MKFVIFSPGSVRWCDWKAYFLFWVWSFNGSVCFRASECRVLCSGRPVFVGNGSFGLWARARGREGGGGRPRCEFTSQNALLSDVPPSKTYRHSRGMNGDECVTAATAAVWICEGRREAEPRGDKDVEFVCRSVKGGGEASAQQTTCSRAGCHVTVNSFYLVISSEFLWSKDKIRKA